MNDQTLTHDEHENDAHSFEELVAQKSTPQWQVSAMRQSFRIPEGKQMTSMEFDKMAKQVADAPIGGPEAKPA